jgi:hypothetical protein
VGLAIWDGGYYLTSLTFTDPPRWKPSVNDMVGKWRLSEEAAKYIQDLGTAIPFHEIEFRADGTFKAINFPGLLESSDERIVLDFYTGTGTWYFDRMRFKPWAISLYFDQGDRLPDYYFLQGKEPPFKIYSGSRIILYEKQ